MRSEVSNLKKSNSNLKLKIKEYEEKLEVQQKDIDDIVSLLQDLKDVELGAFVKEINGTNKVYKIRNFPKDVQEFLLDIIKEYYNK